MNYKNLLYPIYHHEISNSILLVFEKNKTRYHIVVKMRCFCFNFLKQTLFNGLTTIKASKILKPIKTACKNYH